MKPWNPKKSTKSTRRQLVLGLLVFGSLACLSWNVWIDVSYAAAMPASPQSQTGRIYRIVVNHGFVRYVTKAELARANLVHGPIFWLMVALIACAGIFEVWGDGR